MKRVFGQGTGLYWHIRRGGQFKGFALRLAKDPVTGELCCSLCWPGGLLLTGLVHRMPELVER